MNKILYDDNYNDLLKEEQHNNADIIINSEYYSLISRSKNEYILKNPKIPLIDTDCHFTIGKNNIGLTKPNIHLQNIYQIQMVTNFV